MNKIKTTKNEMKQNYRILSVGYCDMQYLLNYESPIAYSSGVYGWSCDYYYIEGVVISTGYSPIDSKNMRDDYKLIREYEQKARELNTREEVQKLLFELVNILKEVKNENMQNL
jgi:hypothetical protein